MITENNIRALVDSLDDHSIKLYNVEKISDKAFLKFNKLKKIGNGIDLDDISNIEFVLERCLEVVGYLSESRTNHYNYIKDFYLNSFKDTPAIGKKLFYDYYFSIHKPYDKTKEHIWKYLFIVLEFKNEKF